MNIIDAIKTLAPIWHATLTTNNDGTVTATGFDITEPLIEEAEKNPDMLEGYPLNSLEQYFTDNIGRAEYECSLHSNTSDAALSAIKDKLSFEGAFLSTLYNGLNTKGDLAEFTEAAKNVCLSITGRGSEMSKKINLWSNAFTNGTTPLEAALEFISPVSRDVFVLFYYERPMKSEAHRNLSDVTTHESSSHAHGKLWEYVSNRIMEACADEFIEHLEDFGINLDKLGEINTKNPLTEDELLNLMNNIPFHKYPDINDWYFTWVSDDDLVDAHYSITKHTC